MAGSWLEVRLKNIRLVREDRPILRNVEWTIRPGERWLLAGGNGAGKTQLLKLIAGSVWPTPTGKELREYYWRKEHWPAPLVVQDEIGYVGPERQDKYERYGWNHSVRRIVGTGLYRTDIPLNALTESDARTIARLLKLLAIESLAERNFLTLSYGERRLALLARALASKPKLLLLDELLNGLDAANGAAAKRWLESTGRSPMPWVLATHRTEDVPSVATHALVLRKGRVMYRGPIAGAPLARWLEPPARAARRSGARRARPVAAGKPLVRLTNGSVYLTERPTVAGITLTLAAGDCWVLHGPNGSGKSTLLRAIYGDFGIAEGGRIEREGVAPGVPIQVFKERVGFVAPHLQADHPQELTVAATVQSGRYASIGLNDAPSAADIAAAKRALAFFGLSAFETRTLRELSYGQLRRVLFARAWVNEPEVLLLDEPFAGIDAPTRRSLLKHLDQLLAQGLTVMLATHHREEWPRRATHELELRGGRARYCGPLRDSPG